MIKVGIISELNLQNVNYGNRLQAYALNNYINKELRIDAESIVFKNPVHKKVTKNYFREYTKLFIKKIIKAKTRNNDFEKRLEECNRFTSNNTKIKLLNNSRMLKKSNYDCYIVGSDVVWAQFNNGVNRNKFLDFKCQKKYKRISYAASFGINWIPNENTKYIYNQLNKFDYISVREKASKELLSSIGVDNVVHCCDPTLLLSKEDWRKVSKPITPIPDKPFIFTYLLGKNEEQRKIIKRYASKNGYLIINIPDANMEKNTVDRSFGDISVNNCSPEQWLWLIDNSSLFVTDSFHGCVFSTIFNKKFIVLERDYSTNINIRMKDYLDYIKQNDKFIDTKKTIDNLDNFRWDYDNINSLLNELIKESKKYLKEALDYK